MTGPKQNLLITVLWLSLFALLSACEGDKPAKREFGGGEAVEVSDDALDGSERDDDRNGDDDDDRDRNGDDDDDRDADFDDDNIRSSDNPFDRDYVPTGAGSSFKQRFPVARDTQVAYLEPGAEFFRARMHLVAKAKRSIRVQAYLFHGDESSYLLADALIERAKEGLDVHVAIDWLANYLPADQKLYQYLQRNGVEVDGYEFLYLHFLGNLDTARNDFGEFFHKNNLRHHDKLFIIDGEDEDDAMAIIGGSNLGNNYFRADPSNWEQNWMDADVLVRGLPAHAAAKTFDRNAKIIRDEASTIGTNTNIIWTLINSVLGDGDRDFDDDTVITARLLSWLEEPFEPRWEEAPVRFVQSRPAAGEDHIHPIYVDLVNMAQDEILIANAYLIPDIELIKALGRAAARGVDIRIMTNTKEIIEVPNVTILGRSYYDDILEMGEGERAPRIYEWGGEPLLENGEGQNHAKMMIVDEKYSLIGSYNLDPRSRKLNSETIAIIRDFTIAETYADLFREWIDPKYVNEIDLDQARDFNTPDNLKEAFDQMISQIASEYL